MRFNSAFRCKERVSKVLVRIRLYHAECETAVWVIRIKYHGSKCDTAVADRLYLKVLDRKR